jgi:hypothetical protein
MAILNSGAKSNISLGFWIGVGLLILGLVVALLQLILGKIRG